MVITHLKPLFEAACIYRHQARGDIYRAHKTLEAAYLSEPPPRVQRLIVGAGERHLPILKKKTDNIVEFTRGRHGRQAS